MRVRVCRSLFLGTPSVQPDPARSAPPADSPACPLPSVLSLLEHSSEALVALDPQWRCLYVNPRAEKALRKTRDELLGRTIWDAFPGAADAPFAAQLRRAVAENVTVEFRVHWPPLGAWFDVRACPSPQGLAVYFRDVSSQVAAERALEESWGHIRLITDSVPGLIGYVDRGLQYCFASAAYADWFGIPPEQVLGRTIPQMLGAAGYEHRRPFIERALRGERVRFDGPTPHRSLGERDCEIAYVPDVAAGGEVRGFYVLVHDVTDRKRTEAALRASEREARESGERLRAALSAADMGTWRLDLRTNLATHDQGMSRLLGLPPRESVEPVSDFFARVHADDRSAVEAAVRRAVADCSTYLAEFRVVLPDGSCRWIRDQGRAFAADGAPPGAAATYMTGASVDISDRRRAEQAVREANQRLLAMMDASPLAVMAVNTEGLVMLWNPAAQRMFGWTADEAVGRFLPAVPEDQADAARDILRRTLAGEPVSALEVRRRRKDGAMFDAALWTSRVVDDAGNPIACLGILADMTERKQAEAAVDQARRDAEAARATAEAANRAKDQFLAVLSHELRTPLTPVVMTLAGLELDRSLSQDVRDDLAMIRRNVELETKLIDDLLDVTRITHGKLRLHPLPTNVHALVEAVLDMLSSDARGRRIEVSVELAASDAMVSGDAARLQQVIWNLVKNAIKFAPEGGHVRVRTSNPSPRALALEVSDDGIGIEPGALPRLFNAFEQAEQSVARQFGGLGLGLAISKALVELHGGTIRAHSAGRGHGATFIAELPTIGAVERLVNQIQPPPTFGGARGQRPVRVLLVDDHPDTLRTLKRLLERMGYDVRPAASAAAALNVLTSESVDVLVSDIGLPDATGHELMRKVRDAHGVPGIAVSGFGMDADLKNSREAGFLMHITKPVDLKQLDAAIKTAVRAPAGR